MNLIKSFQMNIIIILKVIQRFQKEYKSIIKANQKNRPFLAKYCERVLYLTKTC